MNDAELAIRALKKISPVLKILHIADGEEALLFIHSAEQQAEAGQDLLPRVILLDLKLPKVDGFEVLKKIRSHRVTEHIPVVILSSSAEECDISNSYLLGANSFAVKPVAFDQFDKTVFEIGNYWYSHNRVPAAVI